MQILSWSLQTFMQGDFTFIYGIDGARTRNLPSDSRVL
jgi:hypothetical protein